MNFKKLNVTTGWLVFLITSVIYAMTIEPTSSFWDCGEFIATAYKLEVGHPPGAPFFMILARVFALFASPENAALSINVMSALSSSFTILFLFWTITAFAKKLALIRQEVKELTKGQTFAVIGSGLVGALAYAFSDSFWFSAVEGEVYALSSLFTAVVFWAIIKWDAEADTNPRAFKWILLIAYLMGLSIGVHLLNLLCIPAIVFIYYFKNHKFSFKGLMITGVVSLAILGFIQSGIIPGIVKMACGYEVFFTNQMGASFNMGSVVLTVLSLAFITLLIMHSHDPSSKTKLGATIVGALLIIPILGSEYLSGSNKFWMTLLIGGATYLTYRIKTPSSLLNTGMLSFVMILIGYSTFALIVIRSSANPPMDENNPENVFTLLSYLNREQYGDRPLLYGHYWMAPLDRKNPQVDGDPVYFKSFSIKKGKRNETTFNNRFEAEQYINNASEKLELVEEYIISDPKKKSVYNYDDNFAAVFPRMYSSDAKHVREYKKWSDFRGVSVRGFDSQTGQMKTFKKPTAMEDITFLVNYQFNWMYWRYFMWNFAGRQNDIQGHGGLLNGNWLSGVNYIDEQRLGSQDNLPYSMTRNKAYNKLLFLPFILGLIGLFYQLWRDYKNWLVIFLLFVLTGIAIVIYLNQYPMQPRERDYAYVGSFYAFAIWIGLGVYSLFDAIKNLPWKKYIMAAIVTGGLGLFLLLTDFIGGNFHISYSVLYIGFIGLGLMGAIKLLGQKNPDSPTWALVTTAVCLIVPGIMLQQEWDDHNRAERRTAVDFARNYLESCEENAILFTNGDNDTFPLWYAQEVEGIRTDVRVMNLSLSNTDWYIDQMKRKAYESDPLPFSIAEEQYRQGTRDVCIVEEASKIPPELLAKVTDRDIMQKAITEKGLSLDEALEFVKKDNNKLVINKVPYFYIPTKKFRLPLDTDDLIAKGVIEEADTAKVEDQMEWNFPGTNLLKNNLMMLDLLNNFNWERPVYYAVTTGPDAYINLDPYFELEGLAYRLTPIKHPKSPNPNMLGGVNTERMYDNVMNKFQWGNMNVDGIYLDENNLRMTTNLRLHMANLAEELINEGKDQNAKEILDKAFEMMPEKNVPFNQVVIPLIDGYYQLGEDDIANEIAELMLDIYAEDLDYYSSLDPEFSSKIKSEIDLSFRGVINRLNLMVSSVYPQPDEVKDKFSAKFDAAEEAYIGVIGEIEEYENQQKKVRRKSKARF